MEINGIVEMIQNVFSAIISGNITGAILIDLAYIIIIIAIFLFLISLIIRLIYLKKSKEEKIASEILKKISKGVIPKTNKDNSNLIKSEKNDLMEIKDDELTLKDMLIKKFGPKIESQLHTKVEIIDFNASKDKFIAKITVQGHKLQLVLDSSGKIIDYKNLGN